VKGVYEIPCSYGIGETGCSLVFHFKEHNDDINHNPITKLDLDEHSHNTAHRIYMDKALLITREEHYNKIRMREVLEIEIRDNTLNQDECMKLSDTRRPVLNQIKEHQHLTRSIS
jgi:hypothetical protein